MHVLVGIELAICTQESGYLLLVVGGDVHVGAESIITDLQTRFVLFCNQGASERCRRYAL